MPEQETFAEKQTAEIIERKFALGLREKMQDKIGNAAANIVVYTLGAGFIGIGAGLNFTEIAYKKITGKDSLHIFGLKLF